MNSSRTRRTRGGIRNRASKDATLKVERLLLDRLKPHPKNPRRHPEPGSPEWEALAKSIEHGYFDPLVWNSRNGKLVSGHLRKKVLESLGYMRADVVVLDLDEPTHVARMIAANKSVGEDDVAMLKVALDLVAGAEIPLELTGFPEAEARELITLPTSNGIIDEAEMGHASHKCPKCGHKW